jgi:hypothetical protein
MEKVKELLFLLGLEILSVDNQKGRELLLLRKQLLHG